MGVSGQLWSLLLPIVVFGCTGKAIAIDTTGSSATYRDPASGVESKRASGIGIESHDVLQITDQMAQSLLATDAIAARRTPARIVLDSEYLNNQSSARLNKNLLTDRLRVSLNRAMAGRIVFVSREALEMIHDEQTLNRQSQKAVSQVQSNVLAAGKDFRRQGRDDVETVNVLGADYRMTGRISSLDRIDPGTGSTARYYQIVFELVDLQTGVISWSDLYEFEKEAVDDVVYR